MTKQEKKSLLEREPQRAAHPDSPPAQAESAIRQAHAAFIAAINSGDVDRAFTYLTEDFVGMIENRPTLTKAGYRDLLSPFLAAYTTDYHFEIDETVIFAPWAFERIRYWGTFVPKAGGDPTSLTWRALAVWRQEPDGAWRVARYIRTPDPKPG
ncbi:MAG TPA: nuclear transport factor 2 family protein [Anaerolineales bacterium]|nr:nuclear transport factor 2 family protein [Anaerolineales bacterium]